MSLKALHLVFVTALTTLTFGCGIWLLREHFNAAEPERTRLVWGCISCLAGVAVLFYGWHFLKKLKNISYL